ncbi:cysteine-rich small domain-containing protein [Schnuerera sp. xch1]|uniref:cysteine-rich small domain-containing protein n=1 Tax=Schnuerera sp. xch1 TaxID=2874283 RepID=UPI001CBB038A|nr:cysteine-rich small domain-containing protein [Schnuerera sp. xch1]MBZ2175522.1 cysteine-rich small domain-containing protein [Schnuerera sp. xch1]
MENCYRFYRNTSCDYFPCHKVKSEEEFNCMFCYCPLYFLEECGGNYVYNDRIKDCSNCLIPHSPNGYDYINEKLMTENIKRRNKYK